MIPGLRQAVKGGLNCSNRISSPTCISFPEALHLETVPASLHVTPAPHAVAAGIKDEPGTIFSGYAHLQRNTPQTAAYALNDSPAALAAWIVEKFRDWSACNGEVERRFSKDELLGNVTLYWMTETIHSSCRLYYETKKAPLRGRAPSPAAFDFDFRGCISDSVPGARSKTTAAGGGARPTQAYVP